MKKSAERRETRIKIKSKIRKFAAGNAVWLTALLIGLGAAGCARAAEPGEEEVQREVAERVVRFRILPNSSSSEDQELKLKVRDRILEKTAPYLEGVSGQLPVCTVLENHMEELKEEAQRTVLENGFSYPVSLHLGRTEFPEKVYGNCRFPAGVYEALVVEIGAAEGSNWWCMLYPRLCFQDALHPVVAPEQEEILQKLLPEDIYEGITGEKVRFSWKIFSIFKR